MFYLPNPRPTHPSASWRPCASPFFDVSMSAAVLIAILLPTFSQAQGSIASKQEQKNSVASTATETRSAIPLTLTMGHQHELYIPQGLTRIALGDGKIADVQLLRTPGANAPNRLLLSPLAPGSTTLKVWNKGSADAQHYLVHVQQQVQLIQGHVPSMTQWAERQALLSAQTSKESSALNLTQVQAPSQAVQVDVKVVEFNLNQLQQAGIHLFSTRPNSQGFSFGVLSSGSGANASFNSSGQMSNIPGSPLAQAFGLLMNFGDGKIGLNLGLLEGNGLAKILAAPTLVALSGQSARFLSGGEIPIPVAQGNGAVSIEYKSYGIGLTVSPTVLDAQRIVLKVAPEASELDYANAVTLQGAAVPAISTRKADTTVELGDGESFVIGGLVSQSISSMVDKVPLLGDIPVLGTFFKRQEFMRKDRELVIVVTPHLVRPIARDVPIDDRLPGASAPSQPHLFWSNYITGGSALGIEDQSALDLPGFSR